MVSNLLYKGILTSPDIRLPHIKQLNERKMKANIYSAQDYAGLTSKNFTAYYGYECVDENKEWCFEAKFEDQIIKIPFSKLGVKSRDNCIECLLKGVAWLFEKYKLSL